MGYILNSDLKLISFVHFWINSVSTIVSSSVNITGLVRRGILTPEDIRINSLKMSQGYIHKDQNCYKDIY